MVFTYTLLFTWRILFGKFRSMKRLRAFPVVFVEQLHTRIKGAL
jgi:hypothetical protein